MLVLLFSDKLAGEGYLVIAEKSFILVDICSNWALARETAMAAANEKRFKGPGD